MSEIAPIFTEPSRRPQPEFGKNPEKTDVVGQPLSLKETSELEAENWEDGISAATAEAVESVERRERLAQTAAEIAREQSGGPRPEKTATALADRLDNLIARRKKLSFFDFAGKRSFDELIQQTQLDLQKVKEARKAAAQKVIFETMKPLAPIKESLEELPDSAIEQLDPLAELKEKKLELASTPWWQFREKARLGGEVLALKKKIAGEAIAAALPMEQK